MLDKIINEVKDGVVSLVNGSDDIITALRNTVTHLTKEFLMIPLLLELRLK